MNVGDRITIARTSTKGRVVFTRGTVTASVGSVVYWKSRAGKRHTATGSVPRSDTGVGWAPGWGSATEKALAVAQGLRSAKPLRLIGSRFEFKIGNSTIPGTLTVTKG